MYHESNYDPSAVRYYEDGSSDSGIMQINSINSQSLYELYGITDLQDPYENILAGVSIISGFVHQYGEHDGLMAYNMGVGGYQNALPTELYHHLRSKHHGNQKVKSKPAAKRLISLENPLCILYNKKHYKNTEDFMRLDKYLKVSRLIKRRTVANEACDAAECWSTESLPGSYDCEGWRCFGIQMGSHPLKAEVLDVTEYHADVYYNSQTGERVHAVHPLIRAGDFCLT